MAKAKKVRRARQKQAAAKKETVQEVSNTPSKSSRRRNKKGDAIQKLSATEQFQLEYAYVLRDLRLVFILAGAMFALLIILNLILR